MSFQAKTDFVGLESGNLVLKSNTQNASNSVYEIPKSDGSIIGNIIYGNVQNPTCEYAIKGNVISSFNLGKCYNGEYALQSITVSTGAGSEPTFNASAVQIEPDANQTVCTYATSQLSVSTAHHALTFGAFTFTESSSLVLQNSTYTAEANVQPSTINGEPIASDATAGKETVTITMWSNSDTTAPSITLTTGWSITSNWTCTGADSSLFTWTCTLTKYLTATAQS